jgi:hypothetical protein
VIPNWDSFFYVLASQSSGRTVAPHRIPIVILKNLIKFITDWRIWPIGLLFICGMCTLALRWREQQKIGEDWVKETSLLAPTLAWLIVETHKFSLSYLPSRYFVSLLLACALFGSAAFFRGAAISLSVPTWAGANLFPGPRLRIFSRELRFVNILLAVAFLMNCSAYLLVVSSRTYVIFDAQNILSKEERWAGRIVVGAWAASLFWGSNVVTKPVWANYFNDRNIIERFDPVAVVMEPDQEDSAQALARDGIILSGEPLFKLRIKDWDVYIYDLSESRK